jgi:hypothetical protein
LALFDGIDEELAGADAFAEVIAFGFSEGAFGDEVAVGAGDA